VHFDPRCRTLNAPYSTLTLALDEDMQRVIGRYSGGPSNFRPLLIHADKFFFEFRSNTQERYHSGPPPSPDGNHGWGWRFTAMPLLGLQWLREAHVLTDASLEWACWLLDELLGHAQRGLLPRGAVHNTKVGHRRTSCI
jgi:hypothetical protein